MTEHTKRIAVAIAALVAAAVLAAAAYAFRAEFAGAPLIGRLFHTGENVATQIPEPGSRSPEPEARSQEPEVLYWTCPMHPHVKEHGAGKCPECGMNLVPVTSAAAEGRQAASGSATDEQVAAPTAGSGALPASARAEVSIDSRRQQLIGVRLAPVERKGLSRIIRTVGLVRYDETRLTDINLRLEGWIQVLYVDYTGKFISKGEPLFTIYSPELVATQNEYLLALKARDQVKQSLIPEARDHAERLVEAARQRLEYWDLPADQLTMLDERREPQKTLLFRSPVSGFVIDKRAVKGMRVMPGESLYRIADLSVVWVEADIYEQEMPLMRVGQRAIVEVDAYGGEQFSGRVVYIYPYVEERTRTVKLRLAFSNPRGRLKPGMYANVELQAALGAGLVVPTNALLDSGTEQIVFVSKGDGYFEPRRVKAGQRLGDGVQILEGLEQGEQVATGASFFIDSESQLRAALQGFEPVPESAGVAAEPREQLDITFRSQPDPPQSGSNQFEVVVKDPAGKPVAEADVAVAFFMPAMPTMNMPAMRSETKLTPAGNGLYRGSGEVMTPGRWEVSVIVSRKGQRIGMRQLTVVAR